MADPRVTWRLGVDDNVSRAIRGIDAQISGLTKAFRTLGGFAGFATVTAGLTQLGASAARMAGELQDASDKLGVSATELLRLKGAAEESGASFDQVQTALVFLAKTTGEATRGGKEATEAFRLLGIDAAKLAELPLDRRLAVVASQLQQLPAGAQRADLAVKALGRGAADLLPLLGDLDGKLAAVNVTLTDDQVAALDAATDRWEAFKRDAIQGTASAMGELLMAFDRFQERAAKSVVVQPGGGFELRDTATLGQPAGSGKGPSTRGGRRGLSPDEAAAVIGLPGLKDAQAALANLRKITDEADAIVARSVEQRDSTSRQALDALEELDAMQAAWNDELERAASIIEDVQTPIERYAAALEEIKRLNGEGLLTDEQAARASAKAYEDLANSADRAAASTSNKTDALLEDIRNATQGFASDITDIFFDTTQSIGDMFQSLFNRIAQMIVEQAVIQPWLDAIGGLIGGIIGGGIGEITPPNIPKRAMGGPVAAGAPYLVGERGPEIFVPGRSGTIVPHGAMVGGPTINFNIATPDPRAAAAIIAANERTIVAIVNRAMQRAGRMPELVS